MQELTYYTPDEVLQIFQINHATWSKLDEDVESGTISRGQSIYEWRRMNNFVGWSELYRIQNEIFEISLSKTEWLEAVLPEKQKTVWNLCQLLASHARKPVLKPVKILGSECLSASIFLSLKKSLGRQNINIADLRPGTAISTLTDNANFPKLIAEVSKFGVSLSDEVDLKYRPGLNFFQKINIFDPTRFYIDTGKIITFRDLVERILDKHIPRAT
jgi:hypothetical protein